MQRITSLVSVQNGVPCASSLSIAERFDRQHRTVLAAIRKASTDLPQNFSEQNFMLAEYLELSNPNIDKIEFSSYALFGFYEILEDMVSKAMDVTEILNGMQRR